MRSEDNLYEVWVESQSPQIGSMFLTYKKGPRKVRFLETVSRNPLKSGQCFLLKNGKWINVTQSDAKPVAIPSNRVNVSYTWQCLRFKQISQNLSRNPLKSGQCFLQMGIND